MKFKKQNLVENKTWEVNLQPELKKRKNKNKYKDNQTKALKSA